jgi:hypothetical protein
MNHEKEDIFLSCFSLLISSTCIILKILYCIFVYFIWIIKSSVYIENRRFIEMMTTKRIINIWIKAFLRLLDIFLLSNCSHPVCSSFFRLLSVKPTKETYSFSLKIYVKDIKVPHIYIWHYKLYLLTLCFSTNCTRQI